MLSRLKFDIEGLFEEIYNEKLPESVFSSDKTTFADLQSAGLQSIVPLVNKLREYGHSDDNIRSRVFAFIENDVYLNYVMVKYPYLPVTLGIYNKNIDMKFDVVVGNPPYQRKTSKTHKLWVEFLKQSYELSNRYVFYVTPTLLFTGNSKRIDGLRNEIFYSIKYCDFDVNKYFSVSEDICSYLIDKNKIKGENIVVKMKNGETHNQSCEEKTLYSDFNRKIIKSIINKVESFKSPKLKLVSDVSNTDGYRTVKNLLKDGVISKTQSDEYPNEFIHSGSQKYYTYENSKFGNGIKVVINFSSTYEKMFLTNGVLGKQVEGLLVNNQADGERVIRILTSKIFKFYIKNEKSGGFNSGIFKLPNIDLSREWSDEELYSLFGLNENEINFIESNV
jgi:site-specific DNA-methyltransferase (adenine-specific)